MPGSSPQRRMGFRTEMPYERQGDVDGVVFPCGWILDEPTGAIRLYYGGADTCLALATAQLSDVLGYLRAVSHSDCPRFRNMLNYLYGLNKRQQ